MSDNIQGNILASVNKPCQRLLFISFLNQRQSARDWLGQLIDAGIASTMLVVEHGEARHDAVSNGDEPATRQWVGVSFTSSGVVTLSPEYAADLVAYDAFCQDALVDRDVLGLRSYCARARSICSGDRGGRNCT